MAVPAPLMELLTKAGQEQVVSYWGELTESEQMALENQIKDLDARVGLAGLKATLAETLRAEEETKACAVEPPPADWVARADGSDPAAEQRWEELGLRMVAEGKCAACVLAGGMGTRLRFDHPKGLLGDRTVGPELWPSGKSLFQLHAERIISVQRRAQALVGAAEMPTIHFLVMTGEATHSSISSYMEKHNYFGLKVDQVMMFQQGVMPCLTADGKILMEAKGKMAVSPDGNGGFYPALRHSGVLDRLKAAGVEWLQTFSVDNALVRVADPVWYGYGKESEADVVAKTMPKANWKESVGVLTLRDKAPAVIEYSEIGDVRAQETDEAGELKFNAANICLQSYRLDFLAGAAQEFKTIWHLARKDIPTVEGKVPGIKLEGFIFDPFAAAKKFRLLQANRAAEFSAIKNASDSGKPDTPLTALDSLSRLHRSWLRNAGAQLPEDAPDGSGPLCEVSPLVSYRGENLEERAKEVVAGQGPILVQ